MTSASILIVEDEAIIAADLCQRLVRLGYDVVGTSAHGEEAVALTRKKRLSLIMMDIRLAGAMDGIDCAIAIRKQTKLPVVFLTAHYDAEIVERAGGADAFGYIVKPFEERDLRVQVEMALQKHVAEERRRQEKDKLAQRVRRSQKQLRSLTASLMTAQEEERRRVSRELHDGLGQRVALIELYAARIEQELKPAPAAILSQLGEMRQQTVALGEELRSLAFKLHPSILDDLGLEAALRRLCAGCKKSDGMSITFNSRGLPPRVPQATAGALYRIAQEALHNVVKHAGPAGKTPVTLSLRSQENVIKLVICDKGCGFDSAAVHASGGMGLLNMAERARLIGGKLKLLTKPGAGVKITVEAPLSAKLKRVKKTASKAS